MKIPKEIACDLLYLDDGNGADTTDKSVWADFEPNLKKVRSELIDTTRWSHVYEVVYQDLDTGKFWLSTYTTGATESQNEGPYDDDGDLIELTEVFPHKKVITVFLSTP